MSRRKAAPKRNILPDPFYGSTLIAKFVNHIMMHGKKSVAERIVYEALETVNAKIADLNTDEGSDGGNSGSNTANLTPKERSLFILERVLENVSPMVEVKSRRVGGSTYQVPVEVRSERKMTLAMRWLIDAARSRSEKGMIAQLAGELFDAFNKRGAAVKKREDTHRMANANAAFAHYRW